MHVETALEVAALPHTVYDAVAAVERWPSFLPHYRYVRQNADGSFAMAARRGWIPVRWAARVEGDPSLPALRFRHTAGWTRGMEVCWRFEPSCGGTQVTIVHDLDTRTQPLAGEWFARRVVGEFFVEAIARRTLHYVKELLEGRRRSTSP
ncbi:hypothetical protein EPN52_01020 [bacterium]|nr:MAG: hypothetical protein EPN52_01020 [bacterium]